VEQDVVYSKQDINQSNN